MVRRREWTYALGLQVRAAEAVGVLVEVVHLEAAELFGDGFDVCFFVGLFFLHAFGIPLVQH